MPATAFAPSPEGTPSGIPTTAHREVLQVGSTSVLLDRPIGERQQPIAVLMLLDPDAPAGGRGGTQRMMAEALVQSGFVCASMRTHPLAGTFDSPLNTPIADVLDAIQRASGRDHTMAVCVDGGSDQASLQTLRSARADQRMLGACLINGGAIDLLGKRSRRLVWRRSLETRTWQHYWRARVANPQPRRSFRQHAGHCHASQQQRLLLEAELRSLVETGRTVHLVTTGALELHAQADPLIPREASHLHWQNSPWRYEPVTWQPLPHLDTALASRAARQQLQQILIQSLERIEPAGREDRLGPASEWMGKAA